MLRARHAHVAPAGRADLDGAGLPLDASVPASSTPTTVDDLVLDDCAFLGSGARRRGAARLRRPRRALPHRGDAHGRPRPRCSRAAWRSTGNVVADCGDTGILVSPRRGRRRRHDRHAATASRRSRADSGGTGQNGNGINLDKANGVIVADNRVDDCAFSAIRCFSSDDIQVTGNIVHALRRDGALRRVRLRGRDRRRTTSSTAAAGGISFANFMEHGGRLAVCSGNIVRNIRGGPRLPATAIRRSAPASRAEADMAITGNVVENARLGPAARLGRLSARRRPRPATSSAAPRSASRVSVVEGAGPARDLRQPHRRRRAGRHPRHALGGGRRPATSPSKAPRPTRTSPSKATASASGPKGVIRYFPDSRGRPERCPRNLGCCWSSESPWAEQVRQGTGRGVPSPA